jgi:hypothetical protein
MRPDRVLLDARISIGSLDRLEGVAGGRLVEVAPE